MNTQNIDLPATDLEERVTQLETKLAEIEQLLQHQQPNASHPWWQNVFGSFPDCDAFDEMERLGKEWRDRPDDSIESGSD
jgi:hypothetical protein